jgi:hypothetical protein
MVGASQQPPWHARSCTLAGPRPAAQVLRWPQYVTVDPFQIRYDAMRIFVALSLASLLLLLAACAMPPGGRAVAGADCELAAVPPGAVFGTREGMDIATWPPVMQRGVTGCQRVWFGERVRPGAMQVLATYYYEVGRVRRLTGRVPNGGTYDCQYRNGELDSTRSENAAQCPRASELEAER